MHQVLVEVEAIRCVPARSRAPLVAEPVEPQVGQVGVRGRGVLALQPEHDRLGRAVPVAGGAERAEQLGPHPRDAASRPASPSRSTKVLAARIGPTVCEEEGPMPTEYRSNARQRHQPASSTIASMSQRAR